MKILFLFTSILIFACTPNQTPETDLMQDHDSKQEECSNLYPFQGSYIDLDNNNQVLIDGIPSTDFRKCSKYAHRFINQLTDSVSLNGKSFVVNKNKEKEIYLLDIYESKKLITSVKIPVEEPLPEVHEYYIHLLPFGTDIIMILEDMYTTHYLICKYTAEGKEILRQQVEHTFIDHPEPNTNNYNRYLYFFGITSSEMIFTSHIAFADKFKTVLLSMNDFSIKEYNQTANGVILDENEEELIGFATQSKNLFSVKMLSGEESQFDIPDGNPGCEFILKGNSLYIANYHPISTGSSLHCFDMDTGKIKWTADVKQIMASHSEYSNRVYLSMYKNKIIMEGDEEYGDYVQIFDAATGERLAAFGDFLDIKN